MPREPGAPLVVIAAGETSGDQLGAGLIHALHQQQPQLQFAGIGGDAMAAAGLDRWHHIDELSVMGLVEVLHHLPRLLRLRRRFRQRILRQRPALFIGIDAPDFNLPLERALKACGITCVHYVSPSVWAWRPQRVHTIAAACHRLLCLFPFEPQYYAATGLDCVVTGHPRADEIALDDMQATTRRTLNIELQHCVVALLPGSRRSERQRLAPVFLRAAQQLQQRWSAQHAQHPDTLEFISAQPDEHSRQQLQALQQQLAPELPLRFVTSVDSALSACDIALNASGTVTLETLLYHRPQVAAYRLNELTYRWVKTFRLMRSPWLTLPNALAQEMLIDEVFQHEANPNHLAAALENWLNQSPRRRHYHQRALEIHRSLRLNAHQRAAQAVAELL